MSSGFCYCNGINNSVRDENMHAYEHPNELMSFVLELQKSVDEFDQNLVEFDLVLCIGFRKLYARYFHGDLGLNFWEGYGDSFTSHGSASLLYAPRSQAD